MVKSSKFSNCETDMKQLIFELQKSSDIPIQQIIINETDNERINISFRRKRKPLWLFITNFQEH